MFFEVDLFPADFIDYCDIDAYGYCLFRHKVINGGNDKLVYVLCMTLCKYMVMYLGLYVISSTVVHSYFGVGFAWYKWSTTSKKFS